MRRGAREIQGAVKCCGAGAVLRGGSAGETFVAGRPVCRLHPPKLHCLFISRQSGHCTGLSLCAPG